MDQDSPDRDIARLSFEDALSELESLVRRLEEGKGTLDEAIHAYERGTALKLHCEQKLQEAQSRVERIVVDPGGGVAVEPENLD